MTEFEDAQVRAVRDKHIAMAHDVIDALPDSREMNEAVRMIENALALSMRAIAMHGIRNG